MSAKFIVACVQPTAAREVRDNLTAVGELIVRARAQGAEFICLPENAGMIEPIRKRLFEKAEREAEHAGLAGFRDLAAKTGAWLLVGSLAVKLDGDKLANRSYLLDAAGNIVAWYDKIHMFDVDLANGESYRESSAFRSGDRAVLAETPWGPLGMTVCYDLRFPHLYRALAQAGAKYLSIPSSFTRPTGRAHWHVLLRARAIENGCYVFAPAQCGEHAEGRKTYGHSLIVAPWGEVLADGGDGIGVVTAEIDPAKIDEARRMVPSLDHDRPYAPPASPSATRRLAGE
ncbi:MAG: carbon-nitrogen hydrolase family protein [Rhodospirillales bacterium]|nr:carbon-nitrogen hydrolase family protein [Rhodospirillales bacterium]